MCFPSRDPQQLGKFHLSANSCSILIQSSLVGSGMTFGCRMSHMAEHVSTIMLCTVDTPTQNLADSVLNESPVAKKLKYINKFSNLYDFVDQFKSNSYWSPTGSLATAIRNLLCTPPVWFENLLFTLYTLASRLCTSLLTFVPACHVTSKKAAIFQYEENLTKKNKNA